MRNLKKKNKKTDQPPIAATVRYRIRSVVEVPEAAPEIADVRLAVVVFPTTAVDGRLVSQLLIVRSQLTGPAPFSPWQYEILSDRPPRPDTNVSFANSFINTIVPSLLIVG